MGRIFNKHSCTGTDQVLLPSFPATGRWGGASCPSEAKGREHGSGHCTDDYAKPESHFICRDWRGLAQTPRALWSLRHIGTCGPKINVFNRYWRGSLARSRQQEIKILCKPIGTWKEWIGRSSGELGRRSSSGQRRAAEGSAVVRESKHNLHRHHLVSLLVDSPTAICSHTDILGLTGELVGFD